MEEFWQGAGEQLAQYAGAGVKKLTVAQVSAVVAAMAVSVALMVAVIGVVPSRLCWPRCCGTGGARPAWRARPGAGVRTPGVASHILVKSGQDGSPLRL